MAVRHTDAIGHGTGSGATAPDQAEPSSAAGSPSTVGTAAPAADDGQRPPAWLGAQTIPRSQPATAAGKTEGPHGRWPHRRPAVRCRADGAGAEVVPAQLPVGRRAVASAARASTRAPVTGHRRTAAVRLDVDHRPSRVPDRALGLSRQGQNDGQRTVEGLIANAVTGRYRPAPLSVVPGNQNNFS